MNNYLKQRRKTKKPDEIQLLEAHEYDKKYRSRSFNITMPNTLNLDNIKPNTERAIQLPLLPLKKVLAKISGVPKQRFTPNLEQYNILHKAKEKQLRQKYYPKTKRDNVSSVISAKGEEQLDEIVLDCWKYGEDRERIDIWKRYKQNFDELTYNTIRVINNKRRL